MKKILLCISIATQLYALLAEGQQTLSAENEVPPRVFEIDYENNRFLMDGKNFQFIGGSFHYFRALPETWQRKLRTMRAAGLQVVTTYVEWSLHNPRDGIYDFTGIADLELFIKLAAQEDLYVILRPGPYICAERDLGGFPYWLLHKYPDINLRTYDLNYRHEVTKWYQVLMTKMEKFLYGNGGPIIMVQVENEYGSYFACDEKYRIWLRDETSRYVKDKAVLFTNDGPGVLRCGKIPNVLATLDFGESPNSTIDSNWRTLRRYQPAGPLMNSEYYPGWLTHWQEEMQRVPVQPVLDSLEKMILDGASVNFYMFYGGTNFGFTAGANEGGPGRYDSDVTSYDYDAPMDEAGDPTEKYFAIRKLISKYFPLPNVPVPNPLPKIKLPDINLKPISIIFNPNGRRYLANFTKQSNLPMSFESLDQNSGFILYETKLPRINRDPVLLKFADLRDRAYIYVNRRFVGIISRENKIYSIPLSLSLGDELQILVENEGRINYGLANDFKGILGNVYYDTMVLVNFTITGFPLDNYVKMEELITAYKTNPGDDLTLSAESLKAGPAVFYSEFNLDRNQIFDTYLDSTGWGKGIVFINGFNLGRYWPLVGPQITIYVPREVLRVGVNKIAMIELQNAPDAGLVTFSNRPNLDGNFY
ncbi:CLUMA_CG005524, isoform A [Clunio marinus]|uniref:Beta-galactosidase n=1 Tax=Clunio marinus TaxID=568069 RepID=A0A1J1HUZ7_9DIPT|nr:CLUMA_CG005524, isoform A [Clunio marinus]